VAALERTAGAARFEAGLPDVAAIAGLAASLEALAAAGWPSVFTAVAARRAWLAEELAERGIEVLHDGLPGAHAGIVTMAVPEEAGAALADSLARRRVIVTKRRSTLRIAAHALTDEQEIAAFLEAVDEALVSPHGTAPRHMPEPIAPSEAGAGAGPGATGSPTAWSHALVTGASRGLGAALAADLAARGCRLTLLARDAAALEQVADELRIRHGVEVVTALADLSDPAALHGWIAISAARLESVDLLINNAARADAAPFLESESAAERAAFETNLFTPLALARAVLPAMVARGRGALLNLVTAGARNALPLFSAYSASKAALWSWSEALGRELEGSGVTVTTFVPPHMDTTTRRQLGRRALGYYDVGAAADAEAHRPGGAEGLPGIARRALAAAAAGRRLVLPRRAQWEIVANAALPGWVAAQVSKRWKGAFRQPQR
jgi:short-subunit dehydrogenase